jgi:hypothetical protein
VKGFGKERERREAAERLQSIKQQLAEHEQLLARVRAPRKLLNEDLEECQALALGKNKTDAGERAFVRAVFALIEGGVFGIKQVALFSAKRG